MSKERPTTDSIYLTIPELDLIIQGLNLSLTEHYQEYAHLPEALITITRQFIEIKSKFKYCDHCKNFFYQSWRENCNCPKGVGEEE
jgi:hypothetical protein